MVTSVHRFEPIHGGDFKVCVTRACGLVVQLMLKWAVVSKGRK